MDPARGSPPEPAYLALARELEALVASLQVGDRLPSEHELTTRHGVSRLTARAALQDLERRFVVRRVRGAGTFVAPRIVLQLGPDTPADAAEMVRQAGATPGHRVLSVRTRRPTAGVREALELDADERVVSVTHAGTVDGHTAMYGTTHLPAEVVDGIADVLGDGSSIAATLRESFAVDPVRLWLRAVLVTAPPDVAAHLELEGRPLVWQLDSCSHAPRLGRPVELTRSWWRADVVRVVLEVGPAH